MDVDNNTGYLQPEVDLTSCDREPIHVLGRVQEFGFLLAISSDWVVAQASENIGDHLDVHVDDLLGSNLAETFSLEAVRRLRSAVAALDGAMSIERIFGLRLLNGGRSFDVAVHRSGGKIVIEGEPSVGDSPKDITSSVYPLIARLGKVESVGELCQNAARHLRVLTGFDRVMVYRFGEDGSGTVIAEQHKSGMEPFLNLRYPASDIPQQARALYVKNPIRIIADASKDGAIIRPERAPDGQPLDLSLSSTRAVSSIHLEYLRNMGVAASMSVSIIKRGKLWGLFACHHETPRTLPYSIRTAAELFGHLFSFILDQKENDQEREDVNRARLLHDQLMVQITDGSDLAQNFHLIASTIGSVIPFDGVALYVDGEYKSEGSVPTREEFLGLARFLNTAAASQVFHTDSISKLHEPGADFSDRAAGMLVLPVSRRPRDYLVFFRREVAHDVHWAGNPDKPAELGPNGIRLTPRKSFEAWKQTVHGQSKPWTPTEYRAAEALRVTLLEVVLRITDSHIREREKAQEKQELLIAELNHRVRNILNLIHSLVQQSRGTTTDVTEFTDVVGGRIQALARAHDQITRELWQPASVRDLIETEAEAYLFDKAKRIRIEGPDANVEPKAFTTISLVIHELTTNAAKYGALSDRSGHINVTLEQTGDDALRITWKESGGPIISKAPSRKGFGTTIIERSIPYELQGDADIRFETTGLKASFLIPAQNIASFGDRSVEQSGAEVSSDQTGSLEGEVLVVEDNMIIALDAEEFLTALGASGVSVASTVQDGLKLVETRRFTAAVLDVNLGTETSEPVARKLIELDIPFVFASGYGDNAALQEAFPNVPMVQKPYDQAALEAGFRSMAAPGGD